MEFMGGGCLTDILDQFEHVKMTEPQMAFVCKAVRPKPLLMAPVKLTLLFADTQILAIYARYAQGPQRH